MTSSISILGSISREDFLRDYWQKKPLLIRQALPGFTPPLDIDELAGLALEETVESRIVMEQGPEAPWQLFNGPFEEAFFDQLPATNWTLLVQAVDHLLPEVGELLQHFDFLPRWRVDDIMISYAPPGGSVGPHIDYYDVFLLQASGQRRWQLGQFCDESTPLRTDTRLKILTEFQASPEMDWVLEPGDLLYLPPQLAHWGTSLSEDCTTWSVGFRAPSAEEALCGAADFIGERLKEDQRYTDADLTLPRHPAEMDDAAIQRLKNLLQTALDNPAALSEWFGRAITQTKYEDQLLPPEQPWQQEQLEALLRFAAPNQVLLAVAEGSRLAFRAAAEGRWLFADGEAWCYPASLQGWIENLCQQFTFDTQFIKLALQSPESTALLLQLINQGSLYLPDEADERGQALH
ncbi:cupin domain-containing protein [Marinospirillum alkaliphilum]|uniref:50S ribosomal protein L16 3-hydroxylase n=1 Tax=Marinospirillum alkaliphilum DSM 21637 TaxID=1122209 RepID=A0A1K1TT10_9GAMM|nr:cupin domain-containing protein [Marinospirillum alkaliphilum]SFX03704.1 50S ribosomal protein L16 3-hydroxylase [Marinospirillum alkaliphilum DSM 21637]